MALITEIIKKYEVQAKERISDARQSNASADPNTSVWVSAPANDIGGQQPGVDISTKDPTPQDVAYFDWQNKLIEFHKLVKNANFILQEMQNSSQMLSELERLRRENCELKDKLKQYEVQP